MKYHFKLADVPENYSIMDWIFIGSNMQRFSGMQPENKSDPYLRLKLLDFSPELAFQSLSTSADTHGWHGYISHFKDSRSTNDRAPYYGGFSITHNPDIRYAPEHASSLGEPKLNLHDVFSSEYGMKIWVALEDKVLTRDFFDVVFSHGLPAARFFLIQKGIIQGDDTTYDWNKPYTPAPRSKKATYFDSYGFRKMTRAAQEGYHGKFISERVKRSLCRSRVARIDSRYATPVSAEHMWHTDEKITLCMRVNIPITSSPNFVFEIKDVYKGEFQPSYAYTWNTEKLHRVYAKQREESTRINMVLGIVPWFDYDPGEDAYVSNEFFGEMHPFDMFVGGHVITGAIKE